MANEIARPLAAVVAAARRTLPAAGEIARRHERIAAAGDTEVILADVSGSMAEQLEHGARKIDVLQAALDRVRPDWPSAIVIAFATLPQRCAGPLPDPGGNTALHLALAEAERLRPRRTLVIADGRPDDAGAALRAADHLTGTLDTLYIGPDHDITAVGFMRDLARRGGGRSAARSLVLGPAAIAEGIRALLPPGGAR